MRTKKKKIRDFPYQKAKNPIKLNTIFCSPYILTFHPQVLRLLLFARWPCTSCLYYCSPSLTHIHRKNKFKNVSSPQPLKDHCPPRKESSLLTSLTLILMEKNEGNKDKEGGNRRNFYSLKVWGFFPQFFWEKKEESRFRICTDNRWEKKRETFKVYCWNTCFFNKEIK